MAKVKVRLLTSRAGVHTVSYVDARPARDEQGEWLLDEDGAHVMEKYDREQEEGFAQNVGEEIDVDADEAARLIDDGQAELVQQAAPRERKPRKPKASTAEAPAKGESRAKGKGS